MKRDRAARRVATVAAALMGAAGFVLPDTPAAAQTEAEIAGVVQSYQDAFSRCDAELFAGLLHPGFSGYGVSGGLSRDRGAAAESLRSQCDAGLRFDMSIQTLDTADWGTTAFAATVVTGPLTLADGRTVDNPLRVTFLLEREGTGGPLRIRHTHLSAFR